MTALSSTSMMSMEDVQGWFARHVPLSIICLSLSAALHKGGNTVAVVGLYNKGKFLSDVEVVWFTDPPLEFPFSL